ncbi:MAG: PKD domain-containing protein [candidate division WOR-3 bacterium]
MEAGMNARFFPVAFLILLFIHCVSKVNNPPDAPGKPNGPAYGYIDSVYKFSASTSDPDGDNVSIRFSWGDGDTSNWTDYIPSGSSFSVSHAFGDTGRYSVTAQAKDEDDAISNWSAAHTIRILVYGANNYPDAPVKPSGPSIGKPDSFYSFSTYAYDPDGDSISIRFSWGDGDTSGWSDYVANNTSVVDSHVWCSPGNYYIKAQAKDIHGALSPWSAIKSIAIVTNYPPNTPSTPTGPSTGFVDSAYLFSSTATDPEGDSISIRFSWGDGDTSAWSYYVYGGNPVHMYHSWQNPGTYYIKAQAKDGKGALSNWSTSKQITISSTTNHPPDKPLTPMGPTVGYVDSVYYYTSSAVDPDGDSIAIRFDWGDGTISEWSNYFTSGSSISLSHFWTYPGFYYISAQAKDKKGALSGWSDSLEIRIYW